MQAKRKQPDAPETGETDDDGQASAGSGLLKKKRLSRSKADKTSKRVQHNIRAVANHSLLIQENDT